MGLGFGFWFWFCFVFVVWLSFSASLPPLPPFLSLQHQKKRQAQQKRNGHKKGPPQAKKKKKGGCGGYPPAFSSSLHNTATKKKLTQPPSFPISPGLEALATVSRRDEENGGQERKHEEDPGVFRSEKHEHVKTPENLKKGCKKFAERSEMQSRAKHEHEGAGSTPAEGKEGHGALR